MDARTFLETVAGPSRTPTPPGNRHATIDPAYDPSTYPATLPKVTFDGETALTGKRYACLHPYRPVPGDRVLLAPAGSTYVIVGAIRGSDPSFGNVRILSAEQSAGGSGYIGSFGTSEADVTGASVSATVRKGARWAATWTADIANMVATAGLLAVRINVAGVSVSNRELHYTSSNVAAGLRLTPAMTASGTIAVAGSVTWKLRAYRVGGAAGDWRMYDGHTGLTVVVAE